MSNRDGEALFQWTAAYTVGVEEIDGAHRRLFALAEEMHRAMMAGKGKKALQSLLASLVDYTDYHFTQEEALMERIGYAGLGEHRQEHRRLREKVQKMQARSAAGEVTMTIEVAKFLIDWLKTHTITSDRRIAAHLKEALRPVETE